MKFIFPFFIILLFSCTDKRVNNSDVVFEIQNKELFRTNILKVKIINKSKKDYFICLDTTTTYFSLGLNYKINELIHPRPMFYCNDEVIDIGYPSLNSIIKPMTLDTAQSNCFKRNIQHSQEVLKDLSKLKKILLLKSNSSIMLKLPFNNGITWCNKRYTYLHEKGNFEIQFKYKMDKKYFSQIVDKKLILELENQNIKPYYEEIVSNKVPYILK